jgi:hypothetical protein
MIGTSLLAMTAAETAAGRYMRAPDGHGDDGGGTAVAEPPAGGSKDGSEVNDAVITDDDGGEFVDDRQPSDAGDDSLSEDGADGEEGAAPPEPAEPKPDATEARLAALEEQRKQDAADIAYWRGRADGTLNEDGTPVNQPQGDIPPDDAGRPDPANYHYGDTDAQYIADLARYEADKRYDERVATDEIKRQVTEVQKAHDARVEEAKELYPDYDEVVVQGANPDPTTGEPKWFCSHLMTLGIKTSEYGPAIAMDLASNKEESRRIAMLPPLDQAREFGRLEYKAELAAKARKGEGGDEAVPQRAPGAPPPPPRAKGGSAVNEIDPATDDFSDFEKRADRHLRRKKAR